MGAETQTDFATIHSRTSGASGFRPSTDLGPKTPFGYFWTSPKLVRHTQVFVSGAHRSALTARAFKARARLGRPVPGRCPGTEAGAKSGLELVWGVHLEGTAFRSGLKGKNKRRTGNFWGTPPPFLHTNSNPFESRFGQKVQFSVVHLGFRTGRDETYLSHKAKGQNSNCHPSSRVKVDFDRGSFDSYPNTGCRLGCRSRVPSFLCESLVAALVEK